MLLNYLNLLAILNENVFSSFFNYINLKMFQCICRKIVIF